ncbi:MAG: glycosyltransferase [Deferrisomatales bacterium]|nr:glycosyltransferase [Deferrisomatales bacterium]
MELLFHAFVPGEPRAAGTQQSVRVCYFLARNGVRVHLHLASCFFHDRAHVLEFFGLEDEPNLLLYLYSIRQGGRLAKLQGSWWHLRRLLTLLLTGEKRRYDVFFARGHRFPALHVMLRRVLGYKVVFELHEIIYLDRVPEERLLSETRLLDWERYSYRHADGVIAISETLKDLAERKWGRRQTITVIPSGAVTFESRPLPDDHAIRRVFFVGNCYPFSGVDDLVRAIAEVPEATLRVVGGGGPDDPDRLRLAALISRLGLGDRVELRGFVEPSRLSLVYAEADVLAIPLGNQVRCKYFMSPLKLFEYMSARRPIVASAHPTIREILRDGHNALLTEPGRPGSIAGAIARLMADPTLARRIAEQAYADAPQYAMPEKCAAIKHFLEENIVGPAHRARGGSVRNGREVHQQQATKRL